MAQYNAKVMDKNGKTKTITVEAASEDKVKEKVKSEGYTLQGKPVEKGVKSGGRGKKVKDKDLAVFCKQFGSVLNAGVTILSALEMMSEQLDNKTLQSALREAQAYVQKGGTLADGFRNNPKVFPPIMVNMVAAGEMSGNLETS
ncbi:MAG: type II secretion system F family protein, partial [Lachnospiraceae bacterium]|nr:type II secretion system F family protein [Lachnospiraceae bacterium]